MFKLFSVAAGGALGAVLRYAVSGWSYRIFPGVFPWGTLAVNLLGSLVIGILWGLFEDAMVSQSARLFLLPGILGAFTTFSTFSLESFHLIRDGEYGFVAWNIVLSVVLGIALVFTGYFSARYFINILR
jgi:CrcB protein